MARITRVKSARERRNPDGTIKPLLTCDKCTKGIEVGSPYKWMGIKTGPTSSRKLVRCAACPDWHIWEYSSSTAARLAEIEYNARTAIDEAEDRETFESAMSEAADAVREIADEKRESASNIEDGFGHATSASDELNELADELDSWAEELNQAEIPELPDANDADCEECNGAGFMGETGEIECTECHGSGHPDEPTEEQMEEWRSDVEEATSVLDNSPC